MPITDPKDAIGMTYEDAVSLNLDWAGKVPVIDSASHLILSLTDHEHCDEFVLVNLDAYGAVRPCDDSDGFDAAIQQDDAERHGWIRDAATGRWRKP